MLTHNYKIDLMIPSQINKDVIFNEAISKIDNFCNIAIHSFITDRPREQNIGSIHIISGGDNKNSICYCPSKASGWKIQQPVQNMIFFVITERRFVYFNGENWEVI